MDIVRKARPEHVERKQEVRREESTSAQREDARKNIVVETTPLHAPAFIQREMHEVREKIKEIKHPAEKSNAFHAAYAEPRILETHATEENPDLSADGRRAIGVQSAEEHPGELSERMSLDADRPIAYIPKEKPTREEKKMLERIERRERSQKKEALPGKRRGIVMWIIACMALGLGTYLAIAVLPRAEIVLVPKTVKWEYANTIGASTKIADIDPAVRQIPVAVFSEKKTNAFQFPATGSGKGIERKATGRVVIYNEYSGNSQPLVGGTRLETPDGKIFRLKERIVVPGAKTEAGELVPASIEADVVADKAGESYNISPVSKFTIPGFQGTSKYDKFYAESKDPMTGGFVGEGKYPTADDIKAAKESAEKQMKEVIESFLVTQVVPEGFKTIESSRRFAITKETVNEAVDDQGNFSVYIEAEGGVDALKEEHVLKLMTALAQQVNGEGYQIRERTLSYGDITVDAKTGAIALPIDFKGTFWRPITVEEFKRSVFGKDENELKSFIFSSTSIEKADVSLWPFWVKRVPNDVERVKVELK